MFQNTHSNRKDFLFILHEYLGFPPNQDLTSFTIRYYTRLICITYRQYVLQRDYLPSAFSYIYYCVVYFTSILIVSVTVGSRGGSDSLSSNTKLRYFWPTIELPNSLNG